MGWVVGTSGPSTITFPGGNPQDNSVVIQLFDFADVDPEALTGRIEQDKSDWFIKRVILNICAFAYCEGLGSQDNVRFYEWGIGTMGVENANKVTSENYAVWSPETYNLWARQFQTGVAPAYLPATLPFAQDVGEPAYDGFRVAVDSQSSSVPAGYGAMAPFWGPALHTHDFTVSNAGLRNNQGVYLMYNQCEGPALGVNWEEDDQLLVWTKYQVLLQKRRA